MMMMMNKINGNTFHKTIDMKKMIEKGDSTRNWHGKTAT